MAESVAVARVTIVPVAKTPIVANITGVDTGPQKLLKQRQQQQKFPSIQHLQGHRRPPDIVCHPRW